MKHTQEPWVFNSYGKYNGGQRGESGYYIQQRQGREIAKLVIEKRDVETSEQGHNAERIVTCVNACEGISNEGLQNCAVTDLLGELRKAHAIIEQLWALGMKHDIPDSEWPYLRQSNRARVLAKVEGRA